MPDRGRNDSQLSVATLPLVLIPLALGVAATTATAAGGMLALRLERQIAVVMAITAGVVLGVALFDLLPEALRLSQGAWDQRALLSFVALGFACYMLLNGAMGSGDWLPKSWRAHLGPATLTVHSLMDGIEIGVAFQISAGAGWLVAAAVLTHDLADGVNTIGLCAEAHSRKLTRCWLIAKASAPLLGVLVGLAFVVLPVALPPLMAVLAGFFLYIGACELVPRSRVLDPRLRTVVYHIGGMALMLFVTSISG